MLLLPLYVGGLPGESAKFYFFELSEGDTAWLAAAVGILGLLFVAPWVTIGVARVELALARALLGPTAEQLHAARMRRLETSRTPPSTVPSSSDGASSATSTTAPSSASSPSPPTSASAREKLDHDETEEGRAMVAVAHEEAKAALKEIRDLVRGIHPVILEDRGLDAALSAVVARSPIPVALDVKIDQRPPPAVESAAYFVVNETLTNVARHAMATRANVGHRPRRRPPRRRGARRRRRRRRRRQGHRPAGPARPRRRPRRLDVRDQSRRRADDDLRGAAMRVVIAEDSVLLRAGLTRILADAGEEVVATVGAADELMAAVERHQPDLCLVDVRMPPTHTDDGLRAAIAIRQRWPKIGILVLSQYVEERYATDLLAGETRAVGYLLKDRVADVSEFLGAVRRVGDGGTALDPEVVAQLLARSRRRDPLDRLTPPRARGAGADGRGTDQPGDRPRARRDRQGGGEAREQHLHQARPAAGRRRPPPRAGGPAMGGGLMTALMEPTVQPRRRRVSAGCGRCSPHSW